MSEDRQPNENRLGHKGNGAPPPVRSSAPVRGRGAARHYSQRRAPEHSRGQHSPVKQNSAPSRGRGARGARPNTKTHFRSASPFDANFQLPKYSTPKRSNVPDNRVVLPNASSAPNSQANRYTFPDPIDNRTWASSNDIASKRQRLAPNEMGSSSEPTTPSFPVASSSVPGSSSLSQLSQNMSALPRGQYAQTITLPPEVCKGVVGSKDGRKVWLAGKREELASHGENITKVYWHDDHIVVCIKPAKSREAGPSAFVVTPNTHPGLDVDTEMSPAERAERRAGKRPRDENDDPQDRQPPPVLRPHIYAFTSGSLTISKSLAKQLAPLPVQAGTQPRPQPSPLVSPMPQPVQTSSPALPNPPLVSQTSQANPQALRNSPMASFTSQLVQTTPRILSDSLPVSSIRPPSYKPALLRAGMPPPVLPASRAVISSNSPVSSASASTASTSRRAHPVHPSSSAPSASGSGTNSSVKSTLPLRTVIHPQSDPVTRHASSLRPGPAQTSAPVPSSSALSHVPSPAHSMRSLDSSASSTSDSSHSPSPPPTISTPAVRYAPRPKLKGPPPPANKVYVISSDDAHKSSSSSEEDELDSSAAKLAPPPHTSSFSRPSLSPSPSPEPEEGNYPTDEFELTVQGTVSLPNNDNRDKPRRVLVDHPGRSIFTVMYHGFVDRFGRKSRRRTNVYIPDIPAKQYVEDACLLNLHDSAHVLVAHSHRTDGKQLTLVSRSGRVSHFRRRLRPNEKSGATTVCALPAPNRFAASGSDHVVYQWTVSSAAHLSSAHLDADSDEDDDADKGFSAYARPLPIKHTSAVRALLPLSNTLLASGSVDCTVRIFDMGAQAVAHTLNPSNGVTNLHSLATTHPHSVLLEVAHKDLQFEIRDVRVNRDKSFNRFGWLAGRSSGNYVRGSVRGDVFACGDRDGVVRVWDLRNTRSSIETKKVFVSLGTKAKIVQVAFDGGNMYAVSEGNELAFLNTM